MIEQQIKSIESKIYFRNVLLAKLRQPYLSDVSDYGGWRVACLLIFFGLLVNVTIALFFTGLPHFRLMVSEDLMFPIVFGIMAFTFFLAVVVPLYKRVRTIHRKITLQELNSIKQCCADFVRFVSYDDHSESDYQDLEDLKSKINNAMKAKGSIHYNELRDMIYTVFDCDLKELVALKEKHYQQQMKNFQI